jgi:opacity protein-like surface antigen
MKGFLAVATLVIGALPLSARAADAPKLDAFAGYSLLKSDEESRHGWEASAAYNLGRLGLVADLAGHYKGGVDDLSYMAGPRLALHRQKLTPFVHALAGRIRAKSSISVLGVTISESETNWAWAIGGGLSFRVAEHIDVRVQGDYFNIRADGKNDGNPRLAAGVAYRCR